MILLTVSYDGTNYAGWQKQINALSVQQVLEEGLSKLLDSQASVIGGGRTDAGVHALAQKALILKPENITIPIINLPCAVNSFLPADIRVMGAEEAPAGFHPLRQPAVKTYIYRIFNGNIIPPVHRLYAAHERRALDVNVMGHAARHFIGVHDFKGFSSAGAAVKSTVREIYSADVVKIGDMITIILKGNGFLYNMVRIIAGTLVDAGLGKVAADDIPGIIRSGERERAGKTMEARGLTLEMIEYPQV
jgi:tRNA pseudouridine38-40 synthase